MQKLIFFCLGLLFSISSIAQNKIIVKGSVVDTASMLNLGYTSISLISAKDSILQDFTYTDENGKFTLSAPELGDYIILSSHPSFADFPFDINLSQNETILDPIPLTSKTNLLQEVIVRDNRPIIIKGDTVEYNADSFKVREFADVGELLKKLPGLEVDKNGNITAHGEKVKRMLVDGDEFFADDPAVVSKMLRAAAVDKVQVYDDKSEEAKLTGIDDGEKQKTINLKLKDNAKKGYFGKASLGGGLPKYYENQLMINSFNKKRKLAAYGILSNTNKVGLGWNDQGSYGSGNSFSTEGYEDQDISSNNYTYIDGNEMFGGYDGTFRGEGWPRTINGGLHYNNKFGKDDKLKINADYRINSNHSDLYTSTRTIYTMPDTQYVFNSEDVGTRDVLYQSINVNTTVQIDSLSTFSARIKGSIAENKSQSSTMSSYETIAGSKLNSSDQESTKNENTKKIDANLNYSKKFMKKGRSISASLRGNYGNRLSTGIFKSDNIFYQTGTQQNFDQNKQDTSNSYAGKLRVAYTEPLHKDKIFLITNAYTEYTSDRSIRNTYDIINGGADSFNPLYSSSYDFKIWTNSVGANIRMVYGKTRINFGGNIAYTDFSQRDFYRDTLRTRNFINFFPSAMISHSTKGSENYTLSYTGSTRQPSISQIQPLVINTDPINIRVGNPNLKPEFTHRFNANFHKYTMLTGQYFYINASTSFKRNALTEKRTLSSEGINTYQTINLNGNWNVGSWMGYSMQIKPIKTRMSLNSGFNYYRTISILNNEYNKSDNFSVNPTLSLNYNKDSTLSIDYTINPSYNFRQSSINRNAGVGFWQTNQQLEMSYRFPHQFTVGFDFEWMLRQKIDPNDRNTDLFIMNAFVSKSFLKDRSLVIRLEGNDLFNQNLGFSRYAYGDYITEQTYNNIQRYVMIKLLWNFSGPKATVAKANDDEEVIIIEN